MISLRHFPSDSCSDSSLLLAHLLEEAGINGTVLVSGMCDKYTHAWLETQSVIVDITADQFSKDADALFVLGQPPDAIDGVIVSTGNIWHSQFEIVRGLARMDKYDDVTNKAFEETYRQIRANLDNAISVYLNRRFKRVSHL